MVFDAGSEGGTAPFAGRCLLKLWKSGYQLPALMRAFEEVEEEEEGKERALPNDTAPDTAGPTRKCVLLLRVAALAGSAGASAGGASAGGMGGAATLTESPLARKPTPKHSTSLRGRS